MSDCQTCHDNAMSQTSGLSANSYMQLHCPQCLTPSPKPSSPGVCASQRTFNKAFRKAVKNYDKKEQPSNAVMLIVLGVVLLFLVWALLLVAKMPAGTVRVEHYVLAIVFSPIYVLSHYLGRA